MMLECLLSLAGLVAAPDELSVQRYSAEHEDAHLYVLPVEQSTVPKIVILDDLTLTLYPANSSRASLSHTIPADTLLFDLVDTNGDGELELFTLSPSAFYHHSGVQGTALVELFSVEPSLYWTVDRPFLHPLVVPYLDAYHAAIPHLNEIRMMSLTGEEVIRFPKVMSNADALFSLPVQSNQLGMEGSFEFRVDALLTTPIVVPQALRSTVIRELYEPLSPRKLRVAAKMEVEAWPQFPLTTRADDMSMVLYASQGPEHVNTIIRLKKAVPRSVPNSTEPFSFSPKRMYPGTIAIADSGLPDFNGDGYYDLVLWSVPMPGHSTAKLLNSIQSQLWDLEISIHLYNPEKGLYEARPMSRIRTEIALQYLFTRQSQHPLHNLSFADMNHDGKSDLIYSPTPDSVEVWLYKSGFRGEPHYRNTFSHNVSLVSVPSQDVSTESHSILMRDELSIYRLSIPLDGKR